MARRRRSPTPSVITHGRRRVQFDPKSDGADRSYNEIFDESAKLLYKEIDYVNEARNARRFADDFADNPNVRTPEVLFDLTTPRVLTME